VRLSATPGLSVRENVTLPDLRPAGMARWLSPRAERKDVSSWLARLEVSPAEPEQTFATLSGGNQQRAVLARWLRCGARVFLLEEPTHGVDTAAKQAIYAALGDAAAAGAAILMTSSDAEELSGMCDRVLVMRDGVVAATLTDADLTPDTIAARSLAGAVDA
jgi:ribose transport system ATP-binding protein